MGDKYLHTDINAYEVVMLLNDLHQRGYEQLRLFSGLSPTGLSWRWHIYPKVLMDNNGFELHDDNVPFLTLHGTTGEGKPVRMSTLSSDDLMASHGEYLELGKGKDTGYIQWFQQVVEHARSGVYPIAFTDYPLPNRQWSFTNAENLDYPPFTPIDRKSLSDSEIIRYALYALDRDSVDELRYVLRCTEIKPSEHEIADEVRKAINEHMELISHTENGYYKALDYPAKEVIRKEDIKDGLRITLRSGQMVDLMDETILVARRKEE